MGSHAVIPRHDDPEFGSRIRTVGRYEVVGPSGISERDRLSYIGIRRGFLPVEDDW